MKNNIPKLFFLLFLLVCIIVLYTCKTLQKEMLVSTVEVTNVSTNSAEASGNVIDLGDGATQHGHCYAKTPNVTVAGSKTELGKPAGTGGFTSQLKDLEAGTKYYIKAYLSNGNKTVYGKEISFNTIEASPPTLTTTAITSVTATTASSGGNITSDGGASVNARGVCWNTAAGPTAANSKTTNGTGTGSFVSNLSGLTPGATYYVRAYAINSADTAYGNELSFSTTSASPPSLTTTAISGITQTTATSGGNITDDGGATITARGVCWNTATGPTIANKTTTDGTGTGSFASSLTGLTASTKYYVRAYATNGAGTAYGNELSFTTDAVTSTPPTAAVAAATSVTNTTATLNGAVNANGSSTTVTFEYGLTTLYGSTATATQNPVTGTITTNVDAAITGLTPGTLYHFRVKAVNAGGTVYSNDNTITTLQFPTATTEAATSVTNTSAILNGTVDANNLSTTVTFEYGTNISYGSTVNASPNPVTGGNATTVSAAITGLTPGITYHFRVKAVSSGGTAYGEDQIFTTLCTAPSATTDDATSVSNTTATLNGTVNANNFSITVTFEYGTTTDYGSTIIATPSPVTGSTNTVVSAGVINLSPNILYHYRVRVVSCAGTFYGADQIFTTHCTAPSATTNAATLVSNTTATLNGTVNANNFSTTVTFDYGTTISYGSTITASQSPVTGSSGIVVSMGVTGLLPNTLYHYRIKTINCGGTINGTDQTFTTLCAAPIATTDAATDTSDAAVTFNGTVNANNSSTVVTFEYGTTTSYGSTITASQSPVTGISNIAVSAGVTGLTSNTVYHYRVQAVNCGGTIYGSDQTFTTLCPPNLTVNHTVGSVSAVTKTVTYGIVQTNLSGNNKCWITQNLGADNQAVSAQDPTEAAAGWYWQFNHKQGYKHDGSTRTPSTWITSINSSSDWTAANDPCTILLGTGWRIPTQTEWTNVSDNDHWDYFSDPYSSVLKLHQAGYLDSNDGALYNRGGGSGCYWSSIGYSNFNGWYLSFVIFGSGSNSSITNHTKTYGFSVRCLRD